MRSVLKKAVTSITLILALPFILWYRLSSLIVGIDTAFQGMSQLLSLVPGRFGSFLRVAFYRFALKQCPSNCTIGFGVFFSSADVQIGNYVYIGARSIVASSIIENDVMIGSHVSVISGKTTHDFGRIDIPMRLQGGESVPIRLGEDSWIGNGAIIMGNIGKKCIIGAGSVVTKDIEDYSIAAGNPAKIIKKRI